MRIIDADALMETLGITDMDCYKCVWGNEKLGYCNRGKEFIDACLAIENAPTIEPEPQWILCSERLPEEADYKGCSECIDGAVWYYTDKGAMGLGYYYESTKAWSTTYDECPYGEVIAWMPLPEPYKGENNA